MAELKAWLLDRYASSAFNKFTHQPLPCMDGPPSDVALGVIKKVEELS